MITRIGPGRLPTAARAADGRLTCWQIVTGAALLVGYAGYYLCRSNLSVAVPALIADPATGVDRTSIGLVMSAGIVAYAVGKTVTGVAGDFLSGRVLFLGGLFASVAATVAFTASAGSRWFLGCWMINRFAQSAGWGGLTKVAAHWYPARRYGTVMSVLSLSYLFGDAVGRYVLGARIAGGSSWQGMFLFAAGVLAAIGLLDGLLLRASPRDIGLAEPAVSAGNLFGTRGGRSAPDGLRDLLEPFARSPSFWTVCGLSFGMTLVREAFNTWMPTYLVDVHRLEPGAAAQYSALFPLAGGVSALAVGALTDRVGEVNRASVIAWAMALSVVATGALVVGTARHDLGLSLVSITMTALGLLGPYTLLSGAMAMDMGGRKGSATAAGLIDTAGYLGGILSGVAVGGLADSRGWVTAFGVLSVASAGAFLLAVAHLLERRRARCPSGPALEAAL